MKEAVPSTAAPEPITEDRLIGVSEVSSYLRVHPVTASKIIKETGHALLLARHVYIRESAFREWLLSQEGAEQCR